MTRRMSLLAAFAFLPLFAEAQTVPAQANGANEAQTQAVEAVLAEAKADCASFDGGVFAAPAEAVVQVELTGAAPAEVIVDSSLFDCSTMASLWGGTGGAMLHILAGGQRMDHLALGWKVVDWNQPVLLLALHGNECNATGSDACVEALVWGGESFLTIRSPGGDEDGAEEGAEPPTETASEPAAAEGN